MMINILEEAASAQLLKYVISSSILLTADQLIVFADEHKISYTNILHH